MFTGPFEIFENGTFEEYVSVPREFLWLIPDNVEDVGRAFNSVKNSSKSERGA
jgi:threonine dehydrogenase-like Zn-dependent dehydrogenase